jgi:anti-sigma factor RsiW
MRCARAQKMMTAALDGELSPAARRALDAHVAGCAGCRRELAATERTLGLLETLPAETAVSERLEQATLRAVRVAAADEAEKVPWWRGWLPLPAVAVATVAVAVLAFGVLRFAGDQRPPAGVAPRPGTRDERLARTSPPHAASRAPSRAPRGGGTVDLPGEPPPELAAAPDKFMNLPILRNLDKLQHFEAIQTTDLDDEPATPDGGPEPSNG